MDEHNHKYNTDTRPPDEINREIVTDWQNAKTDKERGDLIYIYIMVNWGFFKYRFHQYPSDWLLGALYIQLTKIFPRINLNDGRASVMRYCQESLRRDLWRMWRYDDSLVSPPNQPRKEAVQEWYSVLDSVESDYRLFLSDPDDELRVSSLPSPTNDRKRDLRESWQGVYEPDELDDDLINE